MIRKQYFDIKYPFSNADIEKYELDLNSSPKDKVTSDILHLIFTPKGQRLRMPDYGTDLIQYIFELNDNTLWPEIKKEIKSTITKWISNVTLDDIQIMASDSGEEIYVRIDYSVKSGNYVYKNSIAVEL